MAAEDIEGPGGNTVRMTVARGTVQTASPKPDREIPTKYEFSVGEDVDLSAGDAKRLYELGIVDRPGEPRGGLPLGSMTAPAIGPGHVGLVGTVTR
jgi:hypothetical protein